MNKKNQKPTSRRPAKDGLHTFLMAGDKIRGALVSATRMVKMMRSGHELGILETLVLGHAYIACALMSSNLKKNDRLGLRLDCSGPAKGFVAEVNADGEVRGYLKQVPIPIARPLESFDLRPFIGSGFLKVTKYLEDAKQPFESHVALEHGTIAKDLAHYYFMSEQIPTSFSLSVHFDTGGEVTGAGGLFLQAMPGADDDLRAALEDQVLALPSLGGFLAEGGEPEVLITEKLAHFSPRVVDFRPVRFRCRCSRSGVRSMLQLLDRESLVEMKENGPFPLNVCCHYCNTAYLFNQEELETLYRERFVQPRE